VLRIAVRIRPSVCFCLLKTTIILTLSLGFGRVRNFCTQTSREEISFHCELSFVDGREEVRETSARKGKDNERFLPPVGMEGFRLQAVG
ncbi:hypothetical protein BKA65DRAFT_503842, partial [Rhexocercosporidium sp. MPI-PUGE-AT-0058]